MCIRDRSGTIASTGQLGSHPLTVSAVDINNVQGSIDYNLLVGTTLTISYTQSPTSSKSTENIILVDNAQSSTVTFTATGGTGTLTYTLISSSSVPGSFNTSTGVLSLPSGTDTGTYRFIIKAETTNGDIGYHLYDLIVYTEPTLTSIYPASGPTTGQQVVKITGTNFSSYPNTSSNPTIVTFGSTPATNVSVDRLKNTITCTTPAGSVGAVNVTVSNTNAPLYSKTLTGAYTYQSPTASINLSTYANIYGFFPAGTSYGGFSTGIGGNGYALFTCSSTPCPTISGVTGTSTISSPATYAGQSMTLLPSATSAASQKNIVSAGGQTISLGSSQGSYGHIYLIQTGTNLSTNSAKNKTVYFILNYSDGTSTQASVCVSDYGYNTCPDQTIVQYTIFRGLCKNNGCSFSYQDNIKWSIFGVRIPADSTKTLTSIQLPSSQESNYYRLFSLNLGA